MAENHRLNTLLADMIRIDSVNPSLDATHQGEGEIAQFLGRYMESMGLEVEFQNLGNGRANVIGILKGRGGERKLMFNGHTDTVGVAGMNIEPFDPVIKEGRMYGRGAQDMKSGVAAMIEAVNLLRDRNIRLAGDIIIACVADEEYASIGTEALVKEYRADAAVVTEPTDEKLMIAHKGFVWSRVQVRGKAAHGSRHEDGVDAILKMGKFLAELETLDREILPMKTHRLLGRGSVHTSIISGGTEISVYPAECLLDIERRTLPGETLETIKAEQEKILARISENDLEFTATLDVYFERKPLEIRENESIALALKTGFGRIAGKPSEIGGISFWTDAALLAEAGIPTVIFGPKGAGLHSAVEYVELDSVARTAEVLTETAISYLGIE